MNRLAILALTLVSFYSCNHIENQKENPIRPGIVTITGQIEDYNGSFGTSLLAYTEPVTGLHKTEVVEIDSAGSFITSFQIAHATHKVILVMGKAGISIFAEPDRSYNISISNDGEFSFLGEDGDVNNHIMELEAALKLEFHDDEEIRMSFKKSDTTKYVECREFIVDLSRRRMEFVKGYCDSNLICAEAIDLVTQNLEYRPAWELIAYRWKSNANTVEKRQGLPQDFYSNLYSEYPINNTEAVGCRAYNGYISEIVEVITEELISSGQLIEYYKEADAFTDSELQIWENIYNYDGVTYYTKEFKELSEEKGEVENRLYREANFKKLLETIPNFPIGIGRDLILSEGISSYSFEVPYLPLKTKEWNQINDLLSNSSIFDELIRIDNFNKARLTEAKSNDVIKLDPLVEVEAEEVFNHLIGKYAGKVVYIDFWATWCGPCRQEIPFSKILHSQFAGQDVVFLNLCCRSVEETWAEFIKVEQISGENYLLNFDEYNYLSQMLEIRGLPTYVLVDKNGKIQDKDAPRPSSGELVIAKIQSLLKRDFS